ncbi:MAG TPA: twin-arginine translocase subunit TatC [Steroidobacteraceae bacterium]|nr:twin-arginine translocase subunit TatC [Steroidobacteraceae bacterium]
MTEPGSAGEKLAEGTLISHLIELRERIVKAFIGVLIVFVPLAFFARKIFTLVAQPLVEKLPAGATMIATTPAGTFLTPFKLSFFVAVFIAMPWILYQVWAFVAPGLYQSEKRFAVPLLVSSIVLFYAGVAFAYFVVFPLMFGFFAAVTPEGVEMMTDIGAYLDFVLALFFSFGLAFEIPIATVLLIATGIARIETLRKQRLYVLLGCFVIGMVLTPPDIFSQTLLAVPMYLLYEGGLLLSSILLRDKLAQQAREEEHASQ